MRIADCGIKDFPFGFPHSAFAIPQLSKEGLMLLIKNGHVIDPSTGLDAECDILVENGKIARIQRRIAPASDYEVIDASGKIVAPGLIDCHVHFREPGYEYKETIETGSRAAAKGGFTTVICEPNTNPPIDTVEMVKELMFRVQRKSVVNLYTKACITEGSKSEKLTDIKALSSHDRMVALSDDGNPVCTQELMQHAFELATECNIPISSHCEDSAFSLEKRLAGQYQGFSPAPPYTNETNFIIRDIDCAEKVHGRIHISHVSMASSFDTIRAAKDRGKARISCEITPHHILLDENFIDSADRKPKTTPPMRSKGDLEAARKALVDGTIDVIATDHAPHANEEVLAGIGGLIGLETALGLVLTKLVHTGIMSIRDTIMRMSTNPAKIFNLNAGSLNIGMPADITIIDLDKEWTVDVAEFESKSRNCPFDGWQLKGKTVATIVGGKVVMTESTKC